MKLSSNSIEPKAITARINTPVMHMPTSIKTITLLVFLGLLSACGGGEPDLITTKVTLVVKVYVTATPTLTPTPPPTATPTPTFTPSPTPTPTALPIRVSGDPRAIQLRAPVPQNGALCGVVDTLDFPLDPPNAEGAIGGGDFGQFRRRYDKFHTGEDWGFGSSNFGTPVHSIGHGRVTYAQPLGWGADQGVVILEHTFPGGSRLLSFYGHLDPSSIVLRAGDCVVRGDQVGTIGKPRTRSHLHFELRTNMPNTPGPGYWPVDPLRAGWQPPSATISNYRIESAPGVEWMRPNTSTFARGLGELDEETFLAIEERLLVGLNTADGSLRWSLPITETLTSARLDENGSMIYLINTAGVLKAFDISDLVNRDSQIGSEALSEALTEALTDPDWSTNLEDPGKKTLLPLPGGGVVVSTRNRMSALSASGELLWNLNPAATVVDWTLTDEILILTTAAESAALWSLDAMGAIAWDISISGKLVALGNQVHVYGEEGVYRLNNETRTAELVYALPNGILRWGAIGALPGGGLLVVHADPEDKRLIALDPAGTLRWERSLSDLPAGQVHLLALGDQVYLMLQQNTPTSNDIAVYAVDSDRAELTLIFSGGTRDPIPFPEDTWAYTAAGKYLLFNIAGGGMVALNPQLALEDVLRESTSPQE